MNQHATTGAFVPLLDDDIAICAVSGIPRRCKMTDVSLQGAGLIRSLDLCAA